MKTLRRKNMTLLSILATVSFLLIPGIASAHVVVRPAEVTTASFQTFTVGVPNEKDVSTISLKITVPEGLQYVSPTVKPGWRITIEKQGEGETATVKSIMWTGGEVPAGQRDDFTFSAKVPAAATRLQWNAYQTYSDGVVVSWDQAPTDSESDESKPVGPYSITQVVSTTAADVSTQRVEKAVADAKTTSNRAFYLALSGVVIGLGVLYILFQKK